MTYSATYEVKDFYTTYNAEIKRQTLDSLLDTVKEEILIDSKYLTIKSITITITKDSLHD